MDNFTFFAVSVAMYVRLTINHEAQRCDSIDGLHLLNAFYLESFFLIS